MCTPRVNRPAGMSGICPGFRRAGVLLLLILAPVVSAGCVGAFFRQPVNVETTKDEVEALRREHAQLLALAEELSVRLGQQSEALAALRADSNVQLRELEELIEVLRAQLEDQGTRLEQYRRPRISPPRVTTTRDTTGVGGEVLPDPDMQPREPGAGVYEAARRDYSQGNNELAQAGFEEFIRTQPESDLADNAQFYLGECHYRLGQMDRAIEEYLKVRDLYPDGDQVAAATLKIGYALIRKEDDATARRYFQMVIREYPGSDEARIAQDKLDSLN